MVCLVCSVINADVPRSEIHPACGDSKRNWDSGVVPMKRIEYALLLALLALLTLWLLHLVQPVPY